MKAAVAEKYGPPEVLQVKEVKDPVPGDQEILIKVHSTAVDAADWRVRSAKPFAVRFFFGLLKPRRKILGASFSGVVVATGKDVLSLKTGDAVFGSAGFRFGTYAEYVCLPESASIVIKPASLTHDEAAAIPFGGITALHYLRKAGIDRGSLNVLIIGASGSVGTHALQLAKHYGNTVTAVCSETNISLVRSLGADHTIDYHKTRFEQCDEKYDIVFDAVGKAKATACKSVLKPGGRFVSVNRGLARGGIEKLQFLQTLFSENRLRPVIDRTYPLTHIVDAHRYVEKGHKKGHVIIQI